jgi:hypothetical protein
MNILSDSFSVLMVHWQLGVGILLIILSGQMLVWFGLKMIFGDRLTSGEYYSLSLAGWMLPILLISSLWLLWNFLQRLENSGLIFLIFLDLFATALFLRSRKGSDNDPKGILFVLLGLSGLFIFLRLAFVAKAAMPLYFDSAQHYGIIKNLLGQPASSTNLLFAWSGAVYYHIGFHFVAAWITSILQAEIKDVMLIFGQIILAMIPLSVFFLVRHETRSNPAGILAVLLAGFGWYMPAHAMDWGKYPALASLSLIAFVLSLAYLSVRQNRTLSAGKYWSLNAILFLAFVAAVFTHSRSLIIFGIFILGWMITTLWQRLPKLPQWIFFGGVLLGVVAEVTYIQTEAVLSPLFDPYLNKGLWITGLVLFLTIFAQWAYPKLTFFLILSIALMLGSLFIPAEGIPGYTNLTLLDRPFVEMILFLPLAFLGGVGLAGVEQSLQKLPARLTNIVSTYGNHISIFLVAIILVNAFFKYEAYPSGCCSIVGRDDLVAMDWVNKNLPENAHILISSTELRVLATDSFQGSVGGDAGIWINPLTSRATTPLPYSSDFSQPATFDSLCKMGITHIYIGEIGSNFDDTKISPYPNWYKALLSMPKVKIYQVIGCR